MMSHPRNHSCKDRAARHYQLALKCIDDKNFGLALGNFLLAIKLCPEKATDPQLLETVAVCLENAVNWLEDAGRHQELLKIYQSVLEVFPNCGKIISALGDYLFRHGHVLEAAAQFLRASLADRSLVSARDSLDRANARLVDRWHFTMLNDRRRNAAYGRALRAAAGRLVDGELVLDVGAGTGLLSMMAARAGVSAVYACESSEAMCQVAAATLADNAMEQRVHLVNKWSHQLSVGDDLPRRASLLVTETFDAGLLGEHILKTLQHAWRHLLLPAGAGRVLPSSAAVWAAAVESPELHTQLRVRLPSGVRLRRRLTEPYWSERLDDAPGGYRLLSDPVQVYSVDFNDPDSVERGLSGVRGRHVTCCTATGRLDALVTWFELQLGEGEVLSSAPGEGTCWEQAVYPVPAGREVQPGETLRLHSFCRGHLELRLDDSPEEKVDGGDELTETAGVHNSGMVAEKDSEATESSNGAECAETSLDTGIAGAGEDVAAVAEVTDSSDAEEVSPEALAFVHDHQLISCLGTSLRRWLAERPSEPPPRVLDLCPVPLGRVLDLGGVSVSRPDAAGLTLTADGRLDGTDSGSAAGAASLVQSPAGPGGDRHTTTLDGSSWDAVLHAPILPSGRLDPAVIRAVRSVSLSGRCLLAPARLQLLAVAVSSRLLLHMTSVLPDNTEGFDCSAINVFSVHQVQDFPYCQRAVSSDLTEVHKVSCLDLAAGSVHPQQFSIPVTSAGQMHGLVYWFLPVDGSDGGAGPPAGGRQMAAVLSAPRALQPGDSVTGSVHPTADGVFIALE